jgi:hypothetical protein
MTFAPAEHADDWFESEEPTRNAMVAELQRIKRRTRVRPIPVLALALVVTAGITYKVATKPVVVEAEVVLALTEGALARQSNSIPVDQLREYVSSVLLPDNKLAELIEKRNLSRLRKKLGMQFALDELRGNLEIQIWKNSFVYFDDEDANKQHSARIGLTVRDSDADRAYDLVHDLASIAIESSAIQRQRLAAAISQQVAALREATEGRLEEIMLQSSLKQAALNDAIRRGRLDLAATLQGDMWSLFGERRQIEERLSRIASSPDVAATEIAARNLDMTLSIVEERRPERPARKEFVLVLIAVVVGAGALIGSMLVVGAFDSRVHDTDDVARLGLPVLGQLPKFAGDNVGSMQARGAPRARVPSFLRWRSHR